MNEKTEEEQASVQVTVSPKSQSKTKTRTSATNMTAVANTNLKAKAKRPNGRLCKRKTRKNVRIRRLDAIDFLHNETLLSTASKGSRPKSPPPPGCVDYEFTALTALAADTVPIHTELPPATYETPYALQVLLDLYREQFLTMIRCMKSDDFRKNVEIQIIDEKEKKQKLTAKLEQLEKQINMLIGDSLKLLKTRMTELGITNGYNAKDLMVKAKEIMSHHHELQGEAVQLNHQIPVLEGKNVQLLDINSEESDDIPLSQFRVSLNAIDPDTVASDMEIPVAQVKREPLSNNDEEDEEISSSEFRIRLNVADFEVEPPSVKPRSADISVTPCSIVLPKIVDGAKWKLLTPAQKKFAYDVPQIDTHTRDLPTDILSLNNENKPPSEKHNSTHKHRRKKSHKSKRKHKRGAQDQHELNLTKPVKTEPCGTPSYSRMTSSMIIDPIEDIITRTLNDSAKSSSAGIITPVTSYLNSSITNVSSKERTDQSDYRRVPPVKIALKKFAQENEDFQTTHSANVMRTTVGDLVNSEIEKSLEISNRSTINQPSVPFDYDTVNNRLMSKRSSSERKETRGNGSSEQFCSKSPFLTPTYVLPSPSHLSSKSSPMVREEPFEGLAASMFGSVVNSCRSSEGDISQHSSPYCTPPMNLEFKLNEPSLVSEYPYSNSTPRLPSEASSSSNQRRHADRNKWQEALSLGFDRMFEFVSNKIDSQESVPTKDKFKMKNSTVADKHSPTFALNPPPLFRADSSFLDSPPMPDLPVSPASLEGPFSPVPSLSPPALSSPVSSTNTADRRDEHSNYSEKFRPKGKGWKWP